MWPLLFNIVFVSRAIGSKSSTLWIFMSNRIHVYHMENFGSDECWNDRVSQKPDEIDDPMHIYLKKKRKKKWNGI